VGVARAAKYRNLTETPRPFFYVPLRQSVAPGASLQIRTSLSAAALAPVLAREIHARDDNVAPGEVITMREQVDRTTAPQRIAVTILGVFAAIALVLAAIGLYGVMAAGVAQNARELALRIALGAETADLLRLVLGKGVAFAAAGIAAGLVLALQLTRLMGYLLYRVSPRDPLAFAAAVVTIAAVSVLACVLPAWRAMRTDPLQALRG
jgi:ABC-type antimicrobial peptide transport system permease subunit